MSIRHEVFPSNLLKTLGLRSIASALGSTWEARGYSSSAIAASRSAALISIPRLPFVAALSSAKYSNNVRPADAFDAAEAAESLSTFKSDSLTSSRRDAVDGCSIGFALCVVCSFARRMLRPLDIPLLQMAAMQATSRYAVHRQLAARLAAMPCDAVALDTINVAAFYRMLCHGRSPSRVA